MSANRDRTEALETVKYALSIGYVAADSNKRRRKHFYFWPPRNDLSCVEVSWYDDEAPCVTVNHAGTWDAKALKALKDHVAEVAPDLVSTTDG